MLCVGYNTPFFHYLNKTSLKAAIFPCTEHFYHLFLLLDKVNLFFKFHNTKEFSKLYCPFQISIEEILFHPTCVKVLI